MIGTLFRVERPRSFYGFFAVFLQALAIFLAVPLFITFFQTGEVPRFPTAILVTGMSVVAGLLFMTGLIVATVTRARKEMRRLAYLSYEAPNTPKSES
jgi:predicted transporter